MHDLDSGSSCGDSTVDPEDDLVIERVRYPEPTEDDIRKSRLITEVSCIALTSKVIAWFYLYRELHGP